MKLNRIILVLILSVIYLGTVQSHCSRRLNCKETIYTFEIHSKAFPDSDSVSINDTIWIEVVCPTSLLDKLSQNTIDYSAAENLGTVIRFHKFIGGDILNPGVISAADDFTFVLVYGSTVQSSINPSTNREFLFNEANNIYRFKVGVIPKKTGIFSVAVLDAVNVYTKRNKCDKAGFSITFANTNQHLYFYEQNRPGYTPSEYERTHMSCFKVK